MAYITDKQFVLISRLVKQAGFKNDVAAVDAYGLGIRSVSSLTIREASELIDWLKSGGTPVQKQKEYDLGTRFTSTQGAGKIISAAGADRYMVKFDDGRALILPVSDFKIEA